MKKILLKKKDLIRMYEQEKKSAHDIANVYKCSEHKINYWLAKYMIRKRSLSDAMYAKRNPLGDPFVFKKPHSLEESFLFGLGLGLYWGEGNKKNVNSIRLGNTDPRLIRVFIGFLERIYQVQRRKFRFGLQIFSDMSPQSALRFWSATLRIPLTHFNKVIVTPARSVGTYREKTKHGVLTVYVSNKKLRNLICDEIEKL